MAKSNLGRFVTNINEGDSFYLYAGGPRERKCLVDQVKVNGTVVLLLEGPMNEKYTVSAMAKTEIMPGIYVQIVERKGDGRTALAIEAPRTVRIDRDAEV